MNDLEKWFWFFMISTIIFVANDKEILFLSFVIVTTVIALIGHIKYIIK